MPRLCYVMYYGPLSQLTEDLLRIPSRFDLDGKNAYKSLVPVITSYIGWILRNPTSNRLPALRSMWLLHCQSESLEKNTCWISCNFAIIGSPSFFKISHHPSLFLGRLIQLSTLVSTFTRSHPILILWTRVPNHPYVLLCTVLANKCVVRNWGIFNPYIFSSCFEDTKLKRVRYPK